MTVIDSTWSWRQLNPATPPAARKWHEMCWDPVEGRVLMMGGVGASEPGFDETWELVGDEWNELSPASTPGGRLRYSMCYDIANSRLLAYGGYTTPLGFNTQTWEYAAANWNQLSPATTPSVTNSISQQVYDTINDVPFLAPFSFPPGSVPATDANLNFTFVANNWVRVTLGTEMFRGASFSNAFPRTNYGFCCTSEGVQADGGGVSSPADWNDTWKLPGAGAGTDWVEALAYDYPPPTDRWELRESHRTVWTGDQVFLFGGSFEALSGSPVLGAPVFNDSWLYDLSVWAELTPGGTPPPVRIDHAMIWDPVRTRVVVFGGQTKFAGVPLGDTWVLEPPVTPTEGRAIRATIGL